MKIINWSNARNFRCWPCSHFVFVLKFRLRVWWLFFLFFFFLLIAQIFCQMLSWLSCCYFVFPPLIFLSCLPFSLSFGKLELEGWSCGQNTLYKYLYKCDKVQVAIKYKIVIMLLSISIMIFVWWILFIIHFFATLWKYFSNHP